MDYNVYENVLDDEFITDFLANLDENQYKDGKVGAGGRLNLKQKNRKDLFINNIKLLKKMDEKIYSTLYDKIKANFSDIKYREKWKVGKYIGEVKGHYNVHRDDTDEVAYRQTSMIIALSDPRDYEGGELCFDDLNVSLKLNKGSIVVFKSCLFHHVNPVTSGTRIVLISFFFDDNGRKIKHRLSGTTNFSSYIPSLDTMQLSYNDNVKNIDVNNQKVNNVLSKVVGDIDYSDKGGEHPWTDEQDFWFESNNSETLVITFAGMGWKTSIPTFIFHNFLKRYSNIDKLFIRDIHCRYYLTGLKNSTKSLEETIELIKTKIEHKKYKKVIGIGCSAGGFAAILYGQLLNFDKVIAFSPQVVLNEKKESLIGDIYNAPKTTKWLAERKMDDKFYQKCLDLKNFQPFTTPVDIVYSIYGNKGIDKKHAHYLDDEKCRTFEHPGSDHMIALTLRNNGKLKEIIEREFL